MSALELSPSPEAERLIIALHAIAVLGLVAIPLPVIHMMGKGVGVGGNIANSSGAFFFVWTLLALGVTGLFSVILSVRGLWSLPWRRPR